MAFNPGDVTINALTLTSPRTGVWNMLNNFLSANVLETIFTAGIMAEIEVIDYFDSLGTYQVAGDEVINFAFTPGNGGASANYTLQLSNVKEIEDHGALRTKTFKLVCVAKETMAGQATYAQKGYNTQVSGIVQDLYTQMGTSTPLAVVEQTQGVRNYKVANQPILHAIETLRREAVSILYPSSNFMFWHNADGFNFQSMEGMLNNGDVKTFNRTNMSGGSVLSSLDNAILAWNPIQTFDAMNRIQAGVVNQRMNTFNVHTNEYRTQDFPLLQGITQMGAGIISTLASFAAAFPNANRSVYRYINPNSNINIGKTYMPATIPNKMVNLAQMQEQILHMTVIGDPILKAGKTINNNVPQITVDVSSINPDVQLNGRWLMSKVEHDIRRIDVKPQYLCNLECLKGAYAQSV